MSSYFVTLTARMPHLGSRTVRLEVADRAQAQRIVARLQPLASAQAETSADTAATLGGALGNPDATRALQRWATAFLVDGPVRLTSSDVPVPEERLLGQRSAWELLARAQRRLGYGAEAGPEMDEAELLQLSARELGDLLLDDAEEKGVLQLHTDSLLSFAIPENFPRLVELYARALKAHPSVSASGLDHPLVSTLGTAMVQAVLQDRNQTLPDHLFAHDFTPAQVQALVDFRQRFSEPLAALGLKLPPSWGSASRA